MRNIIAVHTGTGNSLYLASKFKGYEIHFIDEYLSGKESLPEDLESLGIIYPVYCFGLPYPVRMFVDKVLSSRDNSALEYLFTVNTSGGFPGSANRQLEILLSSCNLALAYSNGVRMPDAYLPLKKKASTEAQTHALLEKSKKKIEIIANDVLSRQIRLPGKGITPKMMMRISGKANMPHKENGLSCSDRCTGCGVCHKICPAGNIEIVGNRPVFGDSCISCYACYHRCPENALLFKGAKGQYKGLQATNEMFRR